MLQDQDLAFMSNKLQVPLIVGDIINDRAALSDDVHYGLHEVISDLQPDSALICIALSAKVIAGQIKNAAPSMRVLEMECDRIIQEYGYVWSRNVKNLPVEADDVFDVLIHTADDLEALSELLETNGLFLARRDGSAAEIFKILQTQAKTQAMVADAFMSMAEEQVSRDKDVSRAPVLASSEFSDAVLGDNVITFPAGQAIH